MKNSAFLFFSFVVLLLTACNSSNEMDSSVSVPEAKLVELKVQTKIVQSSVSRAVDTNWDTNDSIGISCYNNSQMETKYKNVRYTTTGDGIFTSNTPIYFLNDKTVDFKAYYPYRPGQEYFGALNNNTKAENQSPEKQKTIDYLWADIKGVNKNNPNKVWGFVHKMTRIALIFKKGEGVDLKDLTSYTISGIRLEGTFIPYNGITEGLGSLGNIELNITGKSEDSILVPPVIIYPQKLKRIKISATLGGEIYSSSKGLIWVPKGEFQSGFIYNYTFTISKNASGPKLELINTEINPWTAQEGGESTVYPVL